MARPTLPSYNDPGASPTSPEGGWVGVIKAAINSISDRIDDAVNSISGKANDGTVVHLAGTETISGAKSFTSPVSVGAPTSDSHAVTRAYYTQNLPTGGSGGISPGGATAPLQVPYRDPSNALVWTAATTVVARAFGWKIATDYAGVDSAGANPTTTKTGITSAVAALPVNGTLFFPDGTYAWTGDIGVTTAGVSITGPGATIAGQFKFGTGNARLEMGVSVHNINFRRELNTTTYGTKGYADGSYFIAVDRARDIEVTACHFYGAAWPIYVQPNIAGDSHDISSLNIHHNFFSECDMALWGAFNPGSPGLWQCLADSYFCNNTVNRSYVRMVGLQGVDGMFIESNTAFMINYGSTGNARFQEKMENIWIGQSDWLHINHNALFESGTESVLLERARHVEMLGNQFAWPGQRVISDAVRITSNSGGAYATGEYATLSFIGNDGTYYSKSLLSLAGDFGGLALGPNTCLYKSDADRFVGTAGQFTGTSTQIRDARRAALVALPHYRYDLTSLTGLTASQVSIADPALTRTDTGAFVHFDRLPAHALTTNVTSLAPYSVVGGAHVPTLTFTATTGQSIANLRGAADNSGTFSGMAVVTARSMSGSNKESSYILQLIKTAAGTLNVLDLSSGGAGYVAGAAADDPSFTWSMTSGTLFATPKASTAGAFSFSFSFSGNLIVG